MQNTLTILPSSRAIRHKILSLKNSNTFLDPIITISEFLNRILSVEDAINLDSDRRNLLLLEASDFKNFDSLEIERNFFTFIQNSSYIFRFLEELSGEEISIDDIELADTYGDYEEHLSVLNELYKRYESICKREGVIDSIFLKKDYTINLDYLKRFNKIHLLLEGYLTNFELNILKQCAKVIDLEIEFVSTSYNSKTTDKFFDLGFEIETDYKYILNLTTLQTIYKEKSEKENKLTSKQFSERIEQVAFIKQELYLMIKEGIEPEHIAVIVPDESFASQIRLFDSEKNFNFAMGRSFTDTNLYKKLQATLQLLDNHTIENSSRINRLGAELFEVLRPIYYEMYTVEIFDSFMEVLLKDEENSTVKELIEKELFNFHTLDIHLKTLSMKQVLHIFLQRVMNLSIDDVGGGKITVMGLLESRGVSYEGVIIVDFNEGYVPRSSEKDLFLNSTIRKHSGLPTQQEREALQKHYYHLLISRAKKVAISYVLNDDVIASRFLTQLGIEKPEIADMKIYSDILFNRGVLNTLHTKEIIAPYDFTSNKLSATSLKSFLTCKRQFYYKYIAKIKSHEIPKELPQEYEIGNILHNALKNLYIKDNSFSDVNRLKNSFEDILDDLTESNPLVRYQIKLWKKRLQEFYVNEIERFREGYKVYSCEESLICAVKNEEVPLGCKHDGLTLYGTVDRIDSFENGLEVIDYKSGSYKLYNAKNLEDATDFQLEFYYLLVSSLGKVNGCSFYDLQKGEIVQEQFLQEKLELLKSHLNILENTKEFNFELCEDFNSCKYCEYKILCDRE